MNVVDRATTAADKVAIVIAKRLPKRVRYWTTILNIGDYLERHPGNDYFTTTAADLLVDEKARVEDE